MSGHEAVVRPFFEAYAARMNAALADPGETDLAGLRAAFADYMVGANPKGISAGATGSYFGSLCRAASPAIARSGLSRWT